MFQHSQRYPFFLQTGSFKKCIYVYSSFSLLEGATFAEIGEDLTIHTILPDDFTDPPPGETTTTTTTTTPNGGQTTTTTASTGGGGGDGDDDGLLIAVIILAVLLCAGVIGALAYVFYFQKR